jgi:hypothetical protein
MTGITPAEFLAILPKKSKEDHKKDIEAMKQMWGTSKNINLNPKVDLEEAAKAVKVIEDNLKKKRIEET